MNDSVQFLVFLVDQQRCALPVSAVERVIRAVEITPLPNGPAGVLGVIDIAGRVLPVISLRKRFSLPERELRPTDQFLITQAGRQSAALMIDEAQAVIQCPQSELIGSVQIGPCLQQIQGVIKSEDGLVVVHDLPHFLGLDEARSLHEAIPTEVLYGT